MHIKRHLPLCLYMLMAAVHGLLVMQGCDMIEYHPYDLRIEGETGINDKNIAALEAKCKGKTSISFAVISDTQRWYDETVDAVNAINSRSKDIDFVIHTGDLSDFGLKLEFEKQRDILNGLQMPYVCLLGNHDCLATGKEVYNRIFGNENFSFVAGNVFFLCLNTNALEFDYTQAVPDFTYIESQIRQMPGQVTQSVVAMHAPPFSEQFNNNVARVFQAYLKQLPDLQCCIYGHVHSLGETDFFGDGTMYYACPCAKKRIYLLFTITPDNYTYEVVSY